MLGYSPMRRGVNLRSLGERSYSGKQILMSVFGLLIVGGLLAAGILLLIDEATINKLDSTKTSSLNNVLGWIFIVIASIILLFGIWKFLTKV